MSFMDYLYENNKPNEHRVYGAVVGIVTNSKDPESLGRVKLKIPVHFVDKETDWVRIAVPMAGKSRGMFFIPEVGDEVLVIFKEGDVTEPYVIGALWNSEEKPPEKNEDGKNNLKIYKSRDNHKISIYDEEDKGYIELKTKNGNKIKIYDKSSGKIVLKDQSGDDKIVLDGDSNTIEISSASKVSIKAGGTTITIDGDEGSVEMESDMKISLTSTNIEIKASGNLNLSADGMINIKGSMVKIN